MHGHEAAVISLGGAAITGLVAVVYKNLRSSIQSNGEDCDLRARRTFAWQEKETEFKLQIIDRLARIETGMNGKDK